MMTEEQVYGLMQPYLDGELDATRRVEVDAYLSTHPEVAEIFATEKQFHVMVKKGAGRIEMPEGLQDRLRKSLDNETVAAPKVIRPAATIWRPMLTVAATVLLALTVGIAIRQYSLYECPYMTSCAGIHKGSLAAKLDLTSSNMDSVRAWTQQKSGLKLGMLPDFKTYGLQIKGAGAAIFSELKKYNAPDGVYVQYASTEPSKDPVTLIVHPWPEEEPMMMNYDEKAKWWRTVHNGMTVVAWKRNCDKAVLTLVSKRPLDEMLQMTREVRGELELQEPPKPVTLRLLSPPKGDMPLQSPPPERLVSF